MLVKQISVFMENKVGMLSKFTEVLTKHNVNVLALCVADTTDFGILRCITKDQEECVKLLKENGFTASVTEVLVAKPSGDFNSLSELFDALSGSGITIEYLYTSALQMQGSICVIFKVNNPVEAIDVLTKKGIKLVAQSEFLSLEA